MTEEHRNGIIITVFSTASAVGKTLISTNMAAKLAQDGYRVCILDFDLQFGDICNYLRLMPEQTLADAQRAAKREMDGFHASDYLTEYKYRELSFLVLAAPLKLEEAYNISVDIVKNIVRQLQLDFDYIVIDTTAAFSELNLAMMDFSTIITFLGIVDFVPTIKNMKIGCDTMSGIGYDSNKIRLILNRSNSKTRIELADVEQLLEARFYHVLPNDFMVAQTSIQTGVPLVLNAQQTELGDSLRELVDRYTNRVVDTEDKGKGRSLLRRIFS